MAVVVVVVVVVSLCVRKVQDVAWRRVAYSTISTIRLLRPCDAVDCPGTRQKSVLRVPVSKLVILHQLLVSPANTKTFQRSAAVAARARCLLYRHACRRRAIPAAGLWMAGRGGLLA